MTYTKHTEIYQFRVIVIKEDGVEIAREEYEYDAQWYDTESVETITEEEAEEYQ